MIKAGELNNYFKDFRVKFGPREDRETEDRERYRRKVQTISGGSILDKDNKTA